MPGVIPLANPPATGMDIQDFLNRQGVPKDKIPIVAGIVWAESKGNAKARNHNSDGSTDRGMYQINTVHKDVTDECADNPICATKAAERISKGWTDFSPWSTMHNGTAQAARGKHFLIKNANTAIGPATVVNAATSAVTAPLDAMKSAAAAFGDFIGAILDPSTWLRIGKIVGGMGLITLGLWQLLSGAGVIPKTVPIPV